MYRTFTFLSAMLVALSAAASGILSTNKSAYQAGESVMVTYTAAPAGSRIWAYQDASLLPLTDKAQISFRADSTGALLLHPEPGRYKVVCERDNQVADSLFFTVAHQELRYEPDEVNIMVLTDPHVLDHSLFSPSSASFQTMMTSSRKMFDLSEELFIALVDSAIEMQPDVVLIPGDLTKDGERISHNTVRYQLDRLTANGIPAYVIPGNHDILNPHAQSYLGATAVATPNIDAATFAQIYAPFGYTGTRRDTASLSYAVQLADQLTLLALDASHGYADGYLSDATLRWALAQADSAALRGDMVMAMMHFQLLEHVDMMGTAVSSALIQQYDSVANLLLQHGVRLMLTGHFHISNISVRYDSLRTDSIVEVSTGAPITYPCPYRWLSVSEMRNAVNVETRYLLQSDTVADMLRYSHDWMQTHIRSLVPNVTEMAWKKRNRLADAAIALGMSSLVPTINKLIACMPTTPAGRAALVDEYLGDEIVLAYLMHSWANENLQFSDSLRAGLTDGLYALVDRLAADNPGQLSFMDKLALKTFIAGIPFVPIIENELQSFLTDCTRYGTNYYNRTNDLYGTLCFPVPPSPATGLPAVDDADASCINSSGHRALKIIRNQQVILRTPTTDYTPTGQIVQ